MSDSRDENGTHEEAWPFERVLKAGIDGARERQKRFQAYVTESNPSLAAALVAEETRFDSLVRTTIEPAMRDVAEQVARSGWHVSVVRDDELDRLDIFATPGIRFYCSQRRARGVTTDLIWPPCYIAFYGCARSKDVRTLIELSEIDASSVPIRSESLKYSSVTREFVHSSIAGFIENLNRVRLQAELS